MKKYISLFLLLIVVAYSSNVRSAVGELAKVTGVVIDAKTGERLPGVIVAVEGTKKGAKTNVNGQFTLRIEPGSYDLKVSFIGYQTKIISNNELKAGETRSVEISLEQQAITGQEVVVTTSMESETQTAQLLARKKAASMNDVM